MPSDSSIASKEDSGECFKLYFAVMDPIFAHPIPSSADPVWGGSQGQFFYSLKYIGGPRARWQQGARCLHCG